MVEIGDGKEALRDVLDDIRNFIGEKQTSTLEFVCWTELLLFKDVIQFNKSLEDASMITLKKICASLSIDIRDCDSKKQKILTKILETTGRASVTEEKTQGICNGLVPRKSSDESFDIFDLCDVYVLNEAAVTLVEQANGGEPDDTDSEGDDLTAWRIDKIERAQYLWNLSHGLLVRSARIHETSSREDVKIGGGGSNGEVWS